MTNVRYQPTGTVQPPAGGYTAQWLAMACAASPGGVIVLDREAARALVKAVRTRRASLPRVGESQRIEGRDCPALVLESRAGGVIHCRAESALPAQRGTLWEVIPSRQWVRDDGVTASPYGSAPWASEAERSRWVLESRGWTVRNPHTGEVGAMRKPWPTRADAEAAAASMPPPSRIGIGD